MEPPEEKLEELFDRGHGIMERLSLRWREHTNRRTIIILVLSGAVAAYLYVTAIAPPDNFPVDTLVAVPAGQTLAETAESL